MNYSHCVNNKLYYTVENILAELASLICHTKNIPKEVGEFYNELQKMSVDLEEVTKSIGLTPDEAAEEFKDIYQDALDIYFNHIIEESKLS